VPLPDETLRREPVEYIQAMANLYRRSGQREAVLSHYNTQFRRRLSERFGVDPALAPAALAAQVKRIAPETDTEALQHILERLSDPKANEQTLLRAASDADDWLRREIG
jgi:hypothetical protein